MASDLCIYVVPDGAEKEVELWLDRENIDMQWWRENARLMADDEKKFKELFVAKNQADNMLSRRVFGEAHSLTPGIFLYEIGWGDGPSDVLDKLLDEAGGVIVAITDQLIAAMLEDMASRPPESLRVGDPEKVREFLTARKGKKIFFTNV